MRSRTLAREAALKGLYQLDLRSSVPDAELDELLALECTQREAQDYARLLVKGTRKHLKAIDAEIEQVAENWDLGRMAAIDRNVLRMAIYEMLHRADIPPAVAINEAVTIAKKYSTKDSGAFVNGILDQVKNRLVARGALKPSTARPSPSSEGALDVVERTAEPATDRAVEPAAGGVHPPAAPPGE